MFEYTDLQGQGRQGEVWSPGPLYNTIWVHRHPDRKPVVVHATKRIEIEYTPPTPPLPRVDRTVLERAEDIRRRATAHLPHLRKATRRTELPPKPSEAEVQAAQVVADLERENQKAHTVYMEAHSAKVPLSDKRFQQLARDGEE